MNEPSNKRAIIVGLFVFLGVAMLITGILIVGNLHETFKKKMRVVTLFEDVSGLQAGNNIWFSGVKIGVVSNLEFYADRKVKVIMKIEVKAQPFIKKDAFVKLSTDGLIGNKILIIYGGSSKSPGIEEGDTLVVEKTFTSDDMINLLQDNNVNLKAITSDFKIISRKLANGDGSIGKLLNENSVYEHIDAATASLQDASAKAKQLVNNLEIFSANLNRKGTLANELATDTIVFDSMKSSVMKLQQISDTAAVFISDLKKAGNNPNTPVGVLLHDEESGSHLKKAMENLEVSSEKLDEDLEAAQHSFLLKGYFKKKAKEEKRDSLKTGN